MKRCRAVGAKFEENQTPRRAGTTTRGLLESKK